jgi:hypothetical protein
LLRWLSLRTAGLGNPPWFYLPLRDKVPVPGEWSKVVTTMSDHCLHVRSTASGTLPIVLLSYWNTVFTFDRRLLASHRAYYFCFHVVGVDPLQRLYSHRPVLYCWTFRFRSSTRCKYTTTMVLGMILRRGIRRYQTFTLIVRNQSTR